MSSHLRPRELTTTTRRMEQEQEDLEELEVEEVDDAIRSSI
jgi:hypothetical protein